MRESQQELEQKLADERDALLQKQREKVENEHKMCVFIQLS